MKSEVTDAAKFSMLRALTEDPAFASISATGLRTFVDACTVLDRPRGDVIYEAGARWDHLAFVVEGSVAMIAVGKESKEHLYDQIGAGKFFGVSAMFDGEPEMARTVVVSRTARVATIPREVVLELCRHDGALAIGFAITLARRVRRTTSLLADQVNLTAEQRIARYLLGFATGDGMAKARDPLPLMTQAQIGAAAGTVKDVAARTIAALEKRSALRRERGNVQWLNREALLRIAAL